LVLFQSSVRNISKGHWLSEVADLVEGEVFIELDRKGLQSEVRVEEKRLSVGVLGASSRWLGIKGPREVLS
jgi:hypothetical protein